MKKQVKKLVLAKETLSLIAAPVVGGAITGFCAGTLRCPTAPDYCQSGAHPC
jgi:hypothetical protein